MLGMGRMPARSAASSWVRGLWASWLALCLLWLAGCAQPVPRTSADMAIWSGRIALQVEDQPSQSFSAMFELRGDARSGGLVLSSPLGNRLAQLDWKDGHAQLLTAQENRSSDSLDLLLQDITGTRIPVEALFSWLQGNQINAEGWQADISGLQEGRLVARRSHPEPRATLRIALDR